MASLSFNVRVFITIIVYLLHSNHSLNVSYDSRALILDGQRRLLISGCIHYPRSTPGMWTSLLYQAKQAGLDVIETYVFWNLHEPKKGQYVFSGRADLVTFLKECQNQGLYVNLRIGPYVCAEWNLGGFPVWLKEEPGMVFRTYNTPYLEAMKKWVDYLVNKMKMEKLFASQGGPIILAQIENEYGNVEGSYGSDGKKYVAWCGQYAKNLTVGVPWIMCQQGDAPTGIINTCNGFYCDGFKTNQPNTPVMWTENWPGWFQNWGNPVPSRPTEDVCFAVARFFARGGSLANYYMYHGGTNFGRTVGGPNIVTSYDYDVMLDEYGLPQNPKYAHTQQLHDILHKYETVIMAQDPPAAIPLGTNLEAHVYGDKKSDCLAFLSNIGKTDATVTFRNLKYMIPAWSVSLLVNCTDVVYNTAQVTSPSNIYTMEKISSLPQETTSDYQPVVNQSHESFDFYYYPEQVGVWGQGIENNSPLEQISTTHDETDYLWYCTNVTSSAEHSVKLEIKNVNDVIHVFSNGKFIASKRGSNIDVSVPLATGTNLLQILVMTMGLKNYGAFLEKTKRGIQGKVTLDGKDITNSKWIHQVGLHGEALQLFTLTGSTKVNWKTGAAKDRPLTWYKSTITIPDYHGPLALDLSGMGKGYVWLNGYNLGRYWSIQAEGTCDQCDYRGSYGPNKCRRGCGDPSQSWYHIPHDWIVPKDNFLVLLEEIGGDPQTVSLVQRKMGVVCGSVGENYPSDDLAVRLECSEGRSIDTVDFAQFGTPEGNCRSFHLGSCGSKNSTSIVKQMCVGKTSCTIPANIDTFGDPCPGKTKRLSVQVSCA